MSHPIRRRQLARGVASLLQAATASPRPAAFAPATTTTPLAIDLPDPAALRP